MAAAFGAFRPAAVGRELTKKHEEFVRGPLAEVAAHFAAAPPRGEITIVIGPPEEAPPAPISGGTGEEAAVDVNAALAAAIANGLTERDAVRRVAGDLKLGRREVYAAMLGLKNGEPVL